MTILAIRCNRRQETVSVPRYSLKKQTWTIIFRIQLMRRHISVFFLSKQRDTAPSASTNIFYMLPYRMYSFRSLLVAGSWRPLFNTLNTSVTMPETIQHWITWRPNKFSLLFLIFRYRERANTSMSIIDIGILTGFKPDQKSLKVESIVFYQKLKVLMLCISVTSFVAYSWGRRTGFPVIVAGITTKTAGVNHFHLAMSQLFSLERGGIEKAEKRGFIIRNLTGEDGTGTRGIHPHKRAT